LAQEGSWSRSPATIYSRADVAAVVKRGAEKFVEIVIEIDTPAHTLAVSRSHPEMVAPCWEWMANGQYKVDVDSDDCMALDPTNIATRTMVATLLQEVAVLTGEDAKYVHIGGDEVKFPCWNSVPAIAAHVAQTYGNTSDAAYSMLQAEWTANVSAAAVVAAGCGG
jgi:hexosaminidase